MATRSAASAEGIRHLVSTYLACSDERARDLKRAASAHDPDALAQVAHSLAGSSASLGASGLASVCRSIESAAVAGELSSVPELLSQMEGTLAQTRASLVSELLQDH